MRRKSSGLISFIVVIVTTLVLVGSVRLWHKSLLLNDLIHEWCNAKKQRLAMEWVFNEALLFVKEHFANFFEVSRTKPFIQEELSITSKVLQESDFLRARSYFLIIKNVSASKNTQTLRISLKYKEKGFFRCGASCLLTCIQIKEGSKQDARFVVNYYTFGAQL